MGGLKSRRSQSSALDPTSYAEYPDQIIVICKDEKLRNDLLKLINGRIMNTKDYIKKMEMPMGLGKVYCNCFEAESFDDTDDENETDTSLQNTEVKKKTFQTLKNSYNISNADSNIN